jgi:ABC-type branched-subunit amino acid transport system substrate-binding protein
MPVCPTCNKRFARGQRCPDDGTVLVDQEQEIPDTLLAWKREQALAAVPETPAKPAEATGASTLDDWREAEPAAPAATPKPEPTTESGDGASVARKEHAIPSTLVYVPPPGPRPTGKVRPTRADELTGKVNPRPAARPAEPDDDGPTDQVRALPPASTERTNARRRREPDDAVDEGPTDVGDEPAKLGARPAGRLGRRAAGTPKRRAWIALVLLTATLVAVGGAALRYRRASRPVPPAPVARVRGVRADAVLFGMTAPFNGPAKDFGRAMKVGFELAWHEQNSQGGLFGKKLALVALDDGGEDELATANVRQLLERDAVFALVGGGAAAAGKAPQKVALSQRALWFGALPGLSPARASADNATAFWFRASLQEEALAVVRYLVDGRGLDPNQIAVVAESGSYGDAGLKAMTQALQARPGFVRDELVTARISPRILEVAAATRVLMKKRHGLRAIVMVTGFAPAARLIHKLRKNEITLPFVHLSLVGSRGLADELRLLGERLHADVIVTQVVPLPDSPLPGVVRFRQALRQAFAYEQPDAVSLEGYLAGRVLLAGLERTGAACTPKALAQALESLGPLDLGIGAAVGLAPHDHQASHTVWLTELTPAFGYRLVGGAWGQIELGAPPARD